MAAVVVLGMGRSEVKILLCIDKPAWSYHQIALALVKHKADADLHSDILALKGNIQEFISVERTYDRVLLFGHQLLDLIPWHKRVDSARWLTGIHSSHAFDHELYTTPDYDLVPPPILLRSLRKFRAVNCVSQRLFNLFGGKGLNLHLTPNGVNTELFKPTLPLSTDGPLRVGFAGTAKGIHDRRKGLREFLIPACQAVGAELVAAVARTESALPPASMPAFHNSYDVFVLPSSSEGFSIALLEASACGRVVISTRVGGSTELITDGVNGFLVDRTVDAIADRLAWIRDHRESAALMGMRMRATVEQEWSWEKRAPAWLSFLKA